MKNKAYWFSFAVLLFASLLFGASSQSLARTGSAGSPRGLSGGLAVDGDPTKDTVLAAMKKATAAVPFPKRTFAGA